MFTNPSVKLKQDKNGVAFKFYDGETCLVTFHIETQEHIWDVKQKKIAQHIEKGIPTIIVSNESMEFYVGQGWIKFDFLSYEDHYPQLSCAVCLPLEPFKKDLIACCTSLWK